MTSRQRNRRPRNWRVSKKDQLFGADRYFRKLEKIFWNYNKIKKALYEEDLAKSVYLSACRSDNCGGSINSISRPTERLAMRELTPEQVISVGEGIDKETIENPREWAVVVEQTLAHFKKEDEIVREVLYRRFIKNEGYPATCIDLEITSGKYYKARDVGLQFARECAIQLGLLNAFEPTAAVQPLKQPLRRFYEDCSY